MLNSRAVAIIVGTTLWLAGNGFGAGKSSRAEVVGSIVGAKGNVLVDHQPVIAKEAVFAGDVVSTGVASGAYLNLRGTAAILVENTELALAATGSPAAMTLVKGAVVVRTNRAEPARVNLPGAFVLVRGGGDYPSICRIAAVNASAVVIADKGEAEIHGAGAPVMVRSGKTVRLENGVPQGGGRQAAGSVYREIPKGFLSPNETGPGTPLKMNDPVHWDEWVLTPGTGRVQILLGDGSYLNVGAGSRMHIIRHDAQSHQTELEIRAGSVRAAVQRVSGTNFKATTPTAVIGVVGTELQADVVGPGQTDVTNLSSPDNPTDDVNVGNTNPSVTQTIVLHPGQMVSVFPNGFSAVTQLTSGLMKATTGKTDVKGGLEGPANTQTQQLASNRPGGQPGGTGATGGGGGTTGGMTGALGHGTGSLVTAGAAGVGAGLGAGALSKMGSAGDNLNSAQNALNDAINQSRQGSGDSNDAAAALNAASSANTQTAAVETETANNIQNQQQQGCGCPSPSGPQ